MLRHDSESSQPGLGRKIIRTWFQAIFHVQKMSFLVLQVVFIWKILPVGPTRPCNLCFFQKRSNPKKQYMTLGPEFHWRSWSAINILKIGRSKMLRHDSESSRPALGRKIIRMWFQVIFDFQKCSSWFCRLFFQKLPPEGQLNQETCVFFQKLPLGGLPKPWN